MNIVEITKGGIKVLNNEKKPNYFTKEWYLEQKKLKKIDLEISNILEVDVKTLYNWKKQINVVGTKLQRGKMEKPSYFNLEWYKGQKELGKKDVEIAEELCVSITPFRRWKKELEM